jgi:N-acetylglucosaminyldiphosphoundecaprenol N-acetyl-beta-D-mannosaminyltransferase
MSTVNGGSGAVGAPNRVEVLGCPIDTVDMDGAVRRCLELIRGGATGNCQVSVNAAKVVECARSPEMASFVRDCALVNADGQSVVWAARLLGHPLPERVAGIDLMQALLAAAEREGLRVFVLGARQEVLDEALARIQTRYPQLLIAGSHDGYFPEAGEQDVVEEIQAASPHILFVAMSSPRKELFLKRHRDHLGVPFAMGVGGAIDVIAGQTSRAPVWMQRLGIEWLYRLGQEPRRMWRRYAVSNLRFVAMLAREVVRTRLLRRRSASGAGPVR